jgi:hypothetical protein
LTSKIGFALSSMPIWKVFVYVQGSPTDCQKVGMGMNPEISVDDGRVVREREIFDPEKLEL